MGVALFQRVARVLDSQLDQLVLGAALRLAQADPRAAPVRKHALHVLRLLRQLQAEHLGGRLASVVVELQQELPDDLRCRLIPRALERVVLRADHPPAAHIDDLHHRVDAVADTGDDVLIAAAHVDRLLPLHELLHIADAVPQQRRLLKAHLARSLRHFLPEPGDHRLAFAAEEIHHLLDNRAVFLRRRFARAGGETFPKLMMQAGAAILIRAENPCAGAQRKQPAQHGEHLAHARRAHVRAEVFRPILLHAAYQLHARIILPGIDAQIGVVLVVLEEDVVLRPVQLDEVALENQRLQIAVAEHHVEVIDALHHRAHLDRVLPTLMKILADAVLEVDRLAHIDDFSLAFHQVAARAGGQLAELEPQQIVHPHSSIHPGKRRGDHPHPAGRRAIPPGRSEKAPAPPALR